MHQGPCVKVESCGRGPWHWEWSQLLGGFPEGSKLGLELGKQAPAHCPLLLPGKTSSGDLGFPFGALAQGSTEPGGSESPSSWGLHPVFQQAVTLPLPVLCPGPRKNMKMLPEEAIT